MMMTVMMIHGRSIEKKIWGFSLGAVLLIGSFQAPAPAKDGSYRPGSLLQFGKLAHEPDYFKAEPGLKKPEDDQSVSKNETRVLAKTTPEEEEPANLHDSLQAYMDYRYSRQKQLAKWAKVRVSNLQTRMNLLEDRILNLKDDTSESWKKEVLPKLKAQHETLNTRLQALKESSKDIWIHVKWSFGEALETCEVNLNQALEKLKESEISKEKSRGSK